MDAVIAVENLGKKYVLRHQRCPGCRTLRDAITHVARAAWQRVRHPFSPNRESLDLEEMWALKDVSFEVQQGERLGIIGRNGAGKSTLLKILSRITHPTTGRVHLRGRASSLLEVGTGFHPELTGRENIFLNGAILGMTRQEIKGKFDEIVAFAEVEKFLDTPVKHYSSGMYVRLAFAVAAHLEPEILIIDEVLAVGDAPFQKKCLGKMREVAGQGRTVLFVSHNLAAVRNICSRALWVNEGKLAQDGETNSVLDAYLQGTAGVGSMTDLGACVRALPPDPAFRLQRVSVHQDGEPRAVFVNSRPIEIEWHYRVLQRTAGLRVFFDLLDEDQDILIRSFNDEHLEAMPVVAAGEYRARAVIPARILAPRQYALRLGATLFNVRSCTGNGIILPVMVETTTGVNRAYPQEPIRAKLQPMIAWENMRVDTVVAGPDVSILPQKTGVTE